MKWYTTISNWSSVEYFDMLEVAIHSCLKNSDYVPYVVCNEPCERVEKLRNKGINVIYSTGKVFDFFLKKFENDQRLKGIAGTYLRAEIPLIETTDPVVLYTDCDVIFNRVSTKMKIKLPEYMACAPEFNPNDWSYFNAGSMIMNVANLKKEYDIFANFVISNIDYLSTNGNDQTTYNTIYNGKWDRLPIEFNWKPYWGYNPNARILHFHGPKPNNIADYFNGCMTNIKLDVTSDGVGLYTRILNMNLEAYKRYLNDYNNLKAEIS